VCCFNVYQIKLGEERQVESSEREVSDEQVRMVCSVKAQFKYKKSKKQHRHDMFMFYVFSRRFYPKRLTNEDITSYKR